MDAPTLTTLMDWHVGQMRDGFHEVRFVVSDDKEARAWAAWIASHDAKDEASDKVRD